MTFHDDSTSVVQALWKENLNFYTHQATIGDTLSGNRNTNLSWTDESSSYQFTDDLTATDGGEMRSAMGRRPSLGMRLKPNDGRHFFESIKIIDLGTEPDGLNVYWYHRPIITGWTTDNLDKEDRTGNVRVTASFDYESTYFTIGQYRGRFAGEGATNSNGSGTVRKAGIARDGLEGRVNRPVELTEGIVAPATIRAAAEAKRAAEVAAANEFIHDFDGVFEPALESELKPTIPESLEGKQQDLEQVEAERAAIFEDALENEDADLERLSELNKRDNELTEAIKEQKATEAASAFPNEPERSALLNTQDAANIGTSDISTTSVPDPANQQLADDFQSNADYAQRSADFANANAEISENSAQAVVETNPKLSRELSENAANLRGLAKEQQRTADIFQESADATRPLNQ
jgi:hypothetical protein